MPDHNDIVFCVTGQEEAASDQAALGGTSKGRMRLGARRSAGQLKRLVARPGEDVVLLQIEGGPALYLHPEAARDLMRAQGSGGATRSALEAPTGEVTVSPQLGWPALEAANAQATRGGPTRGLLGAVVASAFEIISGKGHDAAVTLATAAVTLALDGKVDPGVYALPAQGPLRPLKGSGAKLAQMPAAPAGQPLLVLLHGSFVDTASTFGKLWDRHPQQVKALFDHYGGRVHALDHRTLADSPLANALQLAQACPAGARLHLVSHSRGGVVAEVLARVCAGRGTQAADLALFDDAHASQRDELLALAKLVKERDIRVERIVRVACPARGTLLASGRLDAYLSVLKWGLELAQLPVVPELLAFLGEVARRRADPAELPGLEALMPDAPIVQWLNAPAEPIASELRVVAGDIEGDSLVSWLKTLMSDAFYWTDNDLVVQTRSMYGGALRQSAAQGGLAAASFMLDRGGQVSHFNYFSNDSSVQAIVAGLTQDTPPQFSAIGVQSQRGESATGTRAARTPATGTAQPGRPAVFVLPGILGSNLAVGGKRVWLSLRLFNNFKALAWDPAGAQPVAPDGPLGLVYDKLVEHLQEKYEVVPFAYDWRAPLEDQAAELARALDAAMKARKTSGQPVRIVAHSMGGLLARCVQFAARDTWKRFFEQKDARLLMLGTPNGGSWAPMQVLSGDDTFGNTLVAFGSLFSDSAARRIMAAMPGFIQLQAQLLDPALRLGQSKEWQRLADEDLKRLRQHNFWHTDERQQAAYTWGVPSQPVLDAAVKLREKLDAQAAALGEVAAKMALVVGRARFTPAGVELVDSGVEYLDATDGGDGRVTLQSALLPGVPTWQLDVEHGSLPSDRSAFAAFDELLASGSTRRLTALAGSTRGGPQQPSAPRLVRSRPSRGLGRAPGPAFDGQLLAREEPPPRSAAQAGALRLRVVNGNLRFIGQPLLLGHYVSSALTGTEWVMDQQIGGLMGESLRAGLYPAAVGAAQVFINQRTDADVPLAAPRPAAVVVVGLGEEGTLRAEGLSRSVCQGVLAYAQRVAEGLGGASATFDLAATLIGSGGTGIDVGSSAQAVARGVGEANQRLVRSGWPQVRQLSLVELYLDRATEACFALAALAQSAPAAFQVEAAVLGGTGAMRRPGDTGYRGAAYDFITAIGRVGAGSVPQIEYTLDTQRARSEVRGQATQAGLVAEMVRTGADARNNDEQLRRSLFQLLVPVEIEPFMSGAQAIVLQLDDFTAAMPWELMDSGRTATAADGAPWAVQTKILRKLRTAEFRGTPASAGRDGGALVIGEPLCDDPQVYPPLQAARDEAQTVATALGTQNLLLGPDALATTKALLAEAWRIVHLAGHGNFQKNPDGSYSGGVVLSGGHFLGPNEIRAMRVVPDLVFVNCCHIGRIGDAAAGLGGERPRFAAGVAQELIKIGVRCVVAAGWEVEDRPAQVFASTFYEQLLGGARFIDAVGEARRKSWESRPQGNTWAAYQCYGDPDWRYRPAAKAREALAVPLVVSAPGLALALEAAATDARYRDGSKQAKAERLKLIQALELRHAGPWGRQGAVAEAFGLAYADNDDIDAAIRWYRKAVQAGDASASLKACEQLGNLRVRRGEKLKRLAAARDEIAAGTELLQRCDALAPTAERASLLASACKRLALRELDAGRRGDRAAGLAALRQMLLHNQQARQRAAAAGSTDLFYSAMNELSAAFRLALEEGRTARPDARTLAVAAASLQHKLAQEPDFWAEVGKTELHTLRALAGSQLAGALDGILKAHANLKQRAPASWLWDSVASNARFLLPPYGRVAALAPEKAAARKLLAALEEYAK